MRMSLIIKFKGWITLLVGVLFALFPVQVITVMGGDLGDAGIVITRLFGLVLLAAGWAMARTPGAVPGGSEAVGYAVTDTLAVVVLVLAGNKGVFGVIGYVLAAVYAISACIFTLCYLQGRSNGQ